MKNNNTISIIKILCPIIVILHHTVSLTNKIEIITIANNFIKTHFVGLGVFAVSTIFLISGYLFDSSLNHNKNDKIFWKRKLIRLIIPLSIIILLSVVLGSFISTYTPHEYFLIKDTYKYLLNIIFIPRYNLPGVFVSNPYSSIINGSLWTMPLTILCYLSCFVINKIKFINNKMSLITLLLLISLTISICIGNTFFKSALYPTASFYIGICFNRYRKRIKYDSRLFFLCIILIIALGVVKKTVYVYFVIYPYILFYVINKINVDKAIIKSDFSYEMYLCAFPIRQSLAYFSNNGMNQITHFVLSVVLSMVVGIIIKNCSMLIIKRINRNESLCYRS